MPRSLSIWRPGQPEGQQGLCNYLHGNPYYLDDDCLLIGAQILVNLATGQPEGQQGLCNYLHGNPYYLDDDCLLIGAQIFVNLATRAA